MEFLVRRLTHLIDVVFLQVWCQCCHAATFSISYIDRPILTKVHSCSRIVWCVWRLGKILPTLELSHGQDRLRGFYQLFVCYYVLEEWGHAGFGQMTIDNDWTYLSNQWYMFTTECIIFGPRAVCYCEPICKENWRIIDVKVGASERLQRIAI